jgi:hypothetical protein
LSPREIEEDSSLRQGFKLSPNFTGLGSGIIIGLGCILWLISSLASGFGGIGIVNV